MKQFLKMRVLPVLLAVSLTLSLCVVPATAAEAFPSHLRDYDSVSDWEARLIYNTSFISTAAGALGVETDSSAVFWSLVDKMIAQTYGSVHSGALESICGHYNGCFNMDLANGFFGQLLVGSNEFINDCIAWLLLGTLKLNFVVKRHPETNVLRIYEEVTGIWVVDSAGRYPYVEGPSDTAAGNQWVDTSRVLSFLKTETAVPDPFSRQALENLCANLVADNIQCRIMQISDKYKAICTTDGDFVYCNAAGQPFVSFVDEEEWVVNDDRDDTTVKDGDGEEVEGLPEDVSSGIDMENMLLYLPNGSIALIDDLHYDESSHTYIVDSHDVYNTYITYNYTYYINYTSITYIGQTEEFKKYEVYYELPDGSSSADLTKEDLEQLNLDIDVIPYGRSTKNTSLRSLYHFDGDTREESYWNYCTDFVWNEGASLTYMDAGVFNGALYLDETEHDFTLQLPSDIGTGDFTLQYRIYQSHTLAPDTDSYISFGSVPLFRWSGGYFVDPDGNAMHVTPTGTYNEIALIRNSGTIYYYLNGVCMGSYASMAALNDHITFHFGDEQQTFKYFDELRVLDYALVESGSSYTPTAVPHQSNLVLVYPTDATPVADEYYVFHSSKENLVNGNFTTGELPEGFTPSGAKLLDSTNHLEMGIYARAETEVYSHFTRLSRPNTLGAGSNSGYPYACIYIPVAGANSLKITSGFAESTPLVLSVVLADGSIYSLPVNVFRLAKDNVEMEIPGGFMGFESVDYSDASKRNIFAYIRPDQESYIDILYIELIEGTETDLSVEWVESVTPIDKDSLTTPTLAVRTDLEITSHQIGGVRPSVPEKGMVWALVENQRITSLQIYNGQAWEGVDGRIWTGTRWIPASSYNIITLQDMYDIVDATPDYEYIYTESGFWSWWQKSWIAFTEQLFSALGSGGTGGTGADGGDGSNGLDGVDLDAQDPELIPEEEDSKTFWQFILLLIVGGKSVVSGVREISSGAVSSVPESMDTIVDAFDSGGLAVGVLGGSYLDPDAADLPQDDSGEAVLAEVEEVDPWRYR